MKSVKAMDIGTLKKRTFDFIVSSAPVLDTLVAIKNLYEKQPCSFTEKKYKEYKLLNVLSNMASIDQR